MEVAVEVDLPVAVAVARLMGSAEGFGSGSSSGGVVVGEVRWNTEGACSSGGKKDDIHAVNVSASAFWHKIPDSEIGMQVCQDSSLQNDIASKDGGLGNMNSHPSPLVLDAKLALQRPGKIIRNNTGCTKRSGMVQMEVSKSKTGLQDVNRISPELASSSASCNISDKNILVKQKNSSTGRRGDKRNSKVKHKNRCDSFSLKNGLVGFNSAAGGNNFFGMYGLKPDVFDIKSYENELPLDELLCGSYSRPSIAKDKGKKAANTSNNLLQSVRKACSVLQAQKILQAQNCAETDNSGIRNVSDGIVAVGSAIGQSDGDKGDSCTTDRPSSDKVLESEDKLKMSTVADSCLYQPKDILERLALPPPKDLDVLLSDASKTTTSSKNSADPRLGKQASHRTGLPPFPWSHSFSGHNKLGSDAVKLSASRTICQGRWVRIKNSTALQKGSADLLMDFESLTFDQSLVPSVNHTSHHPENEFAPIDRVVSASGACSTSKVHAEEYSPTRAAAQTLLDMAAYSTENPSEIVKLLKRPSQMPMKTSNSKSKALERSDKLFGAPKSTMRQINPLKAGNNGFPSKKLKLSTDTYIRHPDPVRKGSLHLRSTPLYVKSPPMKLFRDSNANSNSYGVNIVKKSCMMKQPGSSSQHHKFRKS